MSDYRVSVSASPSAIAFASVRGSLGSPLAVAAFGRTMVRHGIVVATAAASAVGHRDGNGVGGVSPSAIAFTSVGGSLGSPSAVAAFGRTMARHGIVVATAPASAVGHRDGIGVGGIATATMSVGCPPWR